MKSIFFQMVGEFFDELKSEKKTKGINMLTNENCDALSSRTVNQCIYLLRLNTLWYLTPTAVALLKYAKN